MSWRSGRVPTHHPGRSPEQRESSERTFQAAQAPLERLPRPTGPYSSSRTFGYSWWCFSSGVFNYGSWALALRSFSVGVWDFTSRVSSTHSLSR